MNNRSTNTSNASHSDKGGRNRLWLSAFLLLALTISTFFVQASATFAQQEGVWSGNVLDETGNPLPALVSVNGVSVQTGDDGRFELKAPAGENDRQIINATLIGYASVSRIHIGSSIQDLRLEMKKMQRFDIQPDQTIEIEDERGTRISIPAGGLINEADGSPAKEPVSLYIHTYDLRNEQMVGDMAAVNAAGEVVSLRTFGAFEAEFRNEKGDSYNLAPGVMASISVPVLDEKDAPDWMPLWYYNFEQGRWIEDGKAIREGDRYSGEVSHFTPWNYDIQYVDPDLGDAPDSSNASGAMMRTYGGTVTARFPTNFNDPIDPGPYHDRTKNVVWLGNATTEEFEAEPPAWDVDGKNNIDPVAPFDDNDQADDGIRLPLTILQCGYTTLDYDVNTPIATTGDLFFNVWFDFNQDGDWEDSLPCKDSAGNLITVPEWAVQDQFIAVPAGLTIVTTPKFATINPGTMWMRATLTTQQAQPSPFTGVPAGGGPASGYLYGETEDYLVNAIVVNPTSTSVPPTPTPVLETPAPTPTSVLETPAPTPTRRPRVYGVNIDVPFKGKICGFEIVVISDKVPQSIYNGSHNPWGQPKVINDPLGSKQWKLIFGDPNGSEPCFSSDDPRFGNTGLHFGILSDMPVKKFGSTYDLACQFILPGGERVNCNVPITGHDWDWDIWILNPNPNKVQIQDVRAVVVAESVPINELMPNLTESGERIELADNTLPPGSDEQPSSLTIPIPIQFAGQKGYLILSYQASYAENPENSSTVTIEVPLE